MSPDVPSATLSSRVADDANDGASLTSVTVTPIDTEPTAFSASAAVTVTS